MPNEMKDAQQQNAEAESARPTRRETVVAQQAPAATEVSMPGTMTAIAESADETEAAQPVPSTARRFPLHRVRNALRITVLALFLVDCARLIILFYANQGALGFDFGRPQLTAGLSPLGGLCDLFMLFKLGMVDPVLPASMTIIILGIVLSLLLKRSFCGWMCPIGTIFDGFGFIGRKIFHGIHIAPRVDEWLRMIKVIIGAIILILVAVPIPAWIIYQFWIGPYWAVSDMAVLLVFLRPGVVIAVVALVVLGSSLLLNRNVWCEYLCPLGGIYGIVSLASPVTVKRDACACIDCGACTKACPMHIDVAHAEKALRNTECNGCMECVAACPKKDALQARLFRKKRIPLAAFPIAVIAIWLIVWVVALATGAWFGVASSSWISYALSTLV